MSNADQRIIILCPTCKMEIPLNDAIKSQLIESMEKEAGEKIKQRQDALAKQEKEFVLKRQAILKQEGDFEAKLKNEVDKKVEAQKNKIEKDAEKKAEEKLQVELKDRDEQIKEKDKALNEAQQAQLKALKREREAEEKMKNFDLEMEKKLGAERGKIEDDVSKRYSENFNFKEQEYQKKINDLSKQAEELKRKADQGSQQLQGEVLELDLEIALREAFPQDIIEPIEKGVKGADVRQKVISNSGKNCGVILWESKRAKDWKEDWLSKLKENLRAESAHIPVIVSTVLPEEAQTGLGQKSGVWICKLQLAVSLASILRNQLLSVAIERSKIERQGTLAESLYEYVTGHEFRQQVEMMIEVYQEMKNQITKEKVSFEKSWKVREAQVDKMLTGTARIVGSIQGKLGNAAFGPVKGLELLEDGKNEITEI